MLLIEFGKLRKAANPLPVQLPNIKLAVCPRTGKAILLASINSVFAIDRDSEIPVQTRSFAYSTSQ